MKNKGIIMVLILLLAILSLVFVYAGDNSSAQNKTELNVSSEGPIDLSSIILDIKSGSHYKGYDNKTLKWMESLGNKKVFVSDNAFVVMNSTDAGKLRSQYVSDAYIVEFIECKVVENHTLGNIKQPKDVLLVKDVRYLGEEIHYLQGS